MKSNQRRFYVDVMQQRAEVTGSFILCIAKIGEKTIKFAIDCGLYQEEEYEKQNLTFPTNPEELEFVVLTHNHIDHSGRLPYLVKKGFCGKIYTTSITQAELGRALNDTARILRDTAKRKNTFALYDNVDVDKTLKQVVGFGYNYPIQVNDNITITFVPNGHITGAAGILFKVHCQGESKDINFLFSGDYNNKNMFFKVAPIRKWITELPLTVIMESTYGCMNSSEIHECFVRNVLNAIKARKTIIIPVFSLGRAQEILYLFRNMQIKYPEYFEDVPIYFDGKLAFFYTDLYYQLQEKGLVKFYKVKRDFLPFHLRRVLDKDLRREIISENDNRCKVIITSSGMGSYGPAQTYIPAYISRDNCLIHFTGYCSENTLGYRMKNTAYGDVVEVGGVKLKKYAEVEFTNEFSAHAKSDELIDFLKKFKDLRFVIVNHGEDSVKDKFADKILKETMVSHVGILGREFFYRIDSNGFVKSMTTHFL